MVTFGLCCSIWSILVYWVCFLYLVCLVGARHQAPGTVLAPICAEFFGARRHLIPDRVLQDPYRRKLGLGKYDRHSHECSWDYSTGNAIVEIVVRSAPQSGLFQNLKTCFCDMPWTCLHSCCLIFEFPFYTLEIHTASFQGSSWQPPLSQISQNSNLGSN